MQLPQGAIMRFRRKERCAFGAAAVLAGLMVGAASASATYNYVGEPYTFNVDPTIYGML